MLWSQWFSKYILLLFWNILVMTLLWFILFLVIRSVFLPLSILSILSEASLGLLTLKHWDLCYQLLTFQAVNSIVPIIFPRAQDDVKLGLVLESVPKLTKLLRQNWMSSKFFFLFFFLKEMKQFLWVKTHFSQNVTEPEKSLCQYIWMLLSKLQKS